MKAVSASIVVLSGSIIFATGATIAHNDTQLTICLVGATLGLFGLWTWWTSFSDRSGKE